MDNLIAESLQAEQQWENSEPVFKHALELDTRNPTALFLMGRMLVVLKHYPEAELYLMTATEVSPRAFPPYNLLGGTYLAMNRYEDAEKTYERAIEFASPGDRKQLAGTGRVPSMDPAKSDGRQPKLGDGERFLLSFDEP